MQPKELNFSENDDHNKSIDQNVSQEHCKNKLEPDKVSNGLETPKLQSAMEATRNILEELKRSTVTDEIWSECFPSMHEVYPGLFVGNQGAALDKTSLKDSGITHVLNVAQGQDSDSVNLDEHYYADFNIIFLGIKLQDSPRVRIYQFFKPAVIFIHQSLSDGGKVLIHSRHGVSRAATFACSYLMIRKQQTVKESLLYIGKFRTVMPNRGFISQLLELHWRQTSFMRDVGKFQSNETGEPLENPKVEINRTNGFKESILTEIHKKCHGEQFVNETKKLLADHRTNGVERSVDFSVCEPGNQENTISENGIHTNKQVENGKIIVNSRGYHDFLTPKEVSAIIEALPVSQEKLNRTKFQEPDMDEVYPGLYIGNKYASLNRNFLKENGITHIVNAAQGDGFSFVNTDELYYLNTDISFLGLRIPKSAYVRIFHIFEKAYAFIDGCLNSGGKILVHSMGGISRASAIACSYIMVKEKQSVKDSLLSIGKFRVAHPNQGFISQLCELEYRRDSQSKDQGICELHWTKSQKSSVNGMLEAKDLTGMEIDSTVKIKPCEVMDHMTDKSEQSEEPYGNGVESRSIAKVGSEPKLHLSPVTEILSILKAIAIKTNMRESITPEINEVYPSLYIGNQCAALDKSFLETRGITHVLNAACGKGSDFVDTSKHYYRDIGFDFLGLKLQDSPRIRIFQFFKLTFIFIKNALNKGGKVLIHSNHGISRAPTLACSYVMLAEQRSCIDSLTSMCRNKAVLPNRGFISQLIELDRRRGSVLNESLNSFMDAVKTDITKANGFPENQEKQINLISLDVRPSIRKSKEAISIMRDLSLTDKTGENETTNNSVYCAENCMWEIIS